MKKCAVCIFLFLLLTGCSQATDEMEIAMALRSKLLQASECSFLANVTADYGDKIHKFSLNCTANSNGDVTFTVLEPDTISGITGKLSGDGGALTFEDTALAFDLIAEDQLSPVSAPWILIKTLRSGYLLSGCREDDKIRLTMDDSYEEDPLQLDIWLNPENVPEHADILYDGKRILSVDVENFEIL